MCSMLQGLFVTDFMSGHRLDGMDGKPIYQKEQRVNMRALVPSTNLSEKDFFLNTHEFQPHSSYRRSRHPKDSCGLQEKPVTQGLVSRARSEPVSEAIPSPQVCSNCKTSTTPLWRRSTQGATLCNACGLYFKARNTARPTSMKRSPSAKVLALAPQTRKKNKLPPTRLWAAHVQEEESVTAREAPKAVAVVLPSII